MSNLALRRHDDRQFTSNTAVAVRPFLKWAGGKRQLLPQLRRFVPPSFSRYFEPFLGSGAFFLDLFARGQLKSEVVLSDTNSDLVGCYTAIAGRVDAVIRELETLARQHQPGKETHYYEVRDQRFNPRRRQLVASKRKLLRYPADLAAMFIYLNRTGFNGLYRLNARGDFNVPIGRYANPQICDAPNLRSVSEALRSAHVTIRCATFDVAVYECAPGDFVYFDPPYAPLTSTSSFTSYTAKGFTDSDQRALQQTAIALVRKGCFVVLSNSTAPLITDLFETDLEARRAGLRTYRVPAKRMINSDATRRGEIDEYIISNVQPTRL